jgi:hypothetical protein
MLRSVDWFNTDVSGLPIDPFFKDQVSKRHKGRLTLQMGLIGSPETAVLNQLKLCNIPEDDRIQLLNPLQHRCKNPKHRTNTAISLS